MAVPHIHKDNIWPRAIVFRIFLENKVRRQNHVQLAHITPLTYSLTHPVELDTKGASESKEFCISFYHLHEDKSTMLDCEELHSFLLILMARPWFPHKPHHHNDIPLRKSLCSLSCFEMCAMCVCHFINSMFTLVLYPLLKQSMFSVFSFLQSPRDLISPAAPAEAGMFNIANILHHGGWERVLHQVCLQMRLKLLATPGLQHMADPGFQGRASPGSDACSITTVK